MQGHIVAGEETGVVTGQRLHSFYRAGPGLEQVLSIWVLPKTPNPPLQPTWVLETQT